MAVSRLLPSGGANDFNLNITGPSTVVTFDKEYAGGSYSITSSAVDTTIDFYAYNSNGTLVGYTSTKAFTASSGFTKLVVLGGTVGDVIGFTFKKTFTTSSATAEVTAGPYITSVSTSSLPTIGSATTITGGNFATDITAVWTSASTATTYTGSVVRTNSTSVTVTRPSVMPVNYAPYTLTLSNPGVSNPVGSNVHQLAGFTVGSAPVFSSSATFPAFSKNVAYTQTATASSANSPITYAITSGALPSSLTMASTSGVISGTSTSTTPASFTITATDAAGSFTAQAATMSNAVPVWVTTGSIDTMSSGSAYSYQLSATDDSGVAPTYTLASGTLPAGITLSSSGLLSGTPSGLTGANLSFTFNATDANGSVVTSGTITVPTFAYEFGSTFTFTSGGQTGRLGPTLGTLQSSYSATAWTQSTSYLNVTTQGIQRWTVPGSGTYRIQCVGAVGGNSQAGIVWGYGASMRGDFSLTGGEIVNILVGQGGVGLANTGGDLAPSGGGGGGSFVWRDSSSAEPLIAAGGGAGGTDQPRTGSHTGRHANIDASTGTSGRAATTDSAERGGIGSVGFGGVLTTSSGGSSTEPGAGAGYKGNGPANGNGNVASSPANGGTGGLCITNENNRNTNGAGSNHGGFGGGGGAAGWYGCSGAGGGYSGGSVTDDAPRTAGGGGGSYNAGTNQVNTANSNTSGGATGASGYVVITKL